MKILILGSGGREHAFAKKIVGEIGTTNTFIAPGNGGTAEMEINLDLKINDFQSIFDFCKNNQIQYILPGPEEPLVNGISDFMQSKSNDYEIFVFGPNQNGAMIEGSKAFSKRLMEKNNIPTAKYYTVNHQNLNEGISFLNTLNPPFVLKADGLAAGKGVLIIDDIKQAEAELKDMIENQKFGSASNTVVIEEYLHGIEVSFFVATDGSNYIILPEAKDYKRIFDDNKGPNTGGMGAISPVSFCNDEFKLKTQKQIIEPTIQGLKNEGINYIGFIFIGLMNVNGNPFVIEYNCRMGDPETEVVIPKIKSSFSEILRLAKLKQLNQYQLLVNEDVFATVVAVSGGYPDAYEKGKIISINLIGIESTIYHSGTALIEDEIFTNGGRVMAITSSGKSIQEATQMSYNTLKNINFENMFYRTDIGKDL